MPAAACSRCGEGRGCARHCHHLTGAVACTDVAGARVGGVWTKHWDSLRTNSSADMMALSDFPFPFPVAPFPHKDEICRCVHVYVRIHTRVRACACMLSACHPSLSAQITAAYHGSWKLANQTCARACVCVCVCVRVWEEGDSCWCQWLSAAVSAAVSAQVPRSVR